MRGFHAHEQKSPVSAIVEGDLFLLARLSFLFSLFSFLFSLFSFSFPFRSFCKSGKPRKTGANAVCTVDDTCYCHVIRLGPKTSGREKHVSVKSTVTGCDVTNCATTLNGFNKQNS